MTDYKPRPCDRCGQGTLDQDYVSDLIQQPLCCEFQLGYGIIAWLCFECRRHWIHTFDTSKLSDEYSEAAFCLEFWKARIGPDTPDEAEQIGLQKYRDLCDREKKIKTFANQWLAGSDDGPDN